MKKAIKMTKTQEKDSTLGLTSLTYPLVEKLENGSYGEKELAKIMHEFTSLICNTRSMDDAKSKIKFYQGMIDKNTSDSIEAKESLEMYQSIVDLSNQSIEFSRSSKERAKMKLIQMISNF